MDDSSQYREGSSCTIETNINSNHWSKSCNGWSTCVRLGGPISKVSIVKQSGRLPARFWDSLMHTLHSDSLSLDENENGRSRVNPTDHFSLLREELSEVNDLGDIMLVVCLAVGVVLIYPNVVEKV